MNNFAPLFSSGKDDWQTPPLLFTQLHQEFDFTIDGAASEGNHLLPRWYGPGSTITEDALTVDWHNERLFINPPYSQVAAFVEKASNEKHHAFCALLIPARTDTRYWHRWIYDETQHTWRLGVHGRFLKGRLKFIDPNRALIQNGHSNSAPFPSVVILFGVYHEE